MSLGQAKPELVRLSPAPPHLQLLQYNIGQIAWKDLCKVCGKGKGKKNAIVVPSPRPDLYLGVIGLLLTQKEPQVENL